MRAAIDVAVSLAEAAGARLIERLGTLESTDVTHKGRVDLVTAADREAEAVVLAGLDAAFPDEPVLAEESSPNAERAHRRWVVDPLDGTTNFVHGFPLFAVSIARETDGASDVAVVHAPVLGETFGATRGGGAFVRDRLGRERVLRVSETDRLIRALLATGFAYDRWERERNNLDEFARLTMATQGVRRGGAAALDLAFVAAGRLDGFWELGLSRWDVAAGALLVTEAGGVVTDLTGTPGHAGGEEVAATNGRIHEELLAALTRT